MNEQATQADIDDIMARAFRLQDFNSMLVDVPVLYRLIDTITALREQNATLTERVAAQSELLAKRGEK